MPTSADLAAAWAKFNGAMDVAREMFATKTVIWKRNTGYVNPFMEGIPPDNYEDISLKCLCNYNYMRTWPITQETETGGEDRQSIQLFFYKKELIEHGMIDDQNRVIFDPARDKVVVDAILYIISGDSFVSQVDNGNDVLFSLIVKRDKSYTGDKEAQNEYP